MPSHQPRKSLQAKNEQATLGSPSLDIIMDQVRTNYDEPTSNNTTIHVRRGPISRRSCCATPMPRRAGSYGVQNRINEITTGTFLEIYMSMTNYTDAFPKFCAVQSRTLTCELLSWTMVT